MLAPLLIAALALAPDAVAADPTVVPGRSYQIAPDLRDCMTPVCGGWWIRQLNRPSTSCADGSRAAWCYVADLGYDVVGWDAATVTDFLVAAGGGYVVVHGEQVWRSYAATGSAFGVLVPRLAFTEFEPRPPSRPVASPAVPPRAYEVTPDMRLCPGPMCGGYWLRALNHAQTTCADGTKAASCHVASIDWSAAGWDPVDVAAYQAGWSGRLLMYGPLVQQAIGPGTYGVLVPQLAFDPFQP